MKNTADGRFFCEPGEVLLGATLQDKVVYVVVPDWWHSSRQKVGHSIEDMVHEWLQDHEPFTFAPFAYGEQS